MLRFYLLLLMTAVSTALLAPTGAQGADGYKSCRGVKDVGPTGMDPADATKLRVRKVSCATGRKVVRAWVPATVRSRAEPTIQVGSYRCTNRIPNIVCKKKGGKRVRFFLGG